jgi:hypothetical protein
MSEIDRLWLYVVARWASIVIGYWWLSTFYDVVWWINVCMWVIIAITAVHVAFLVLLGIVFLLGKKEESNDRRTEDDYQAEDR